MGKEAIEHYERGFNCAQSILKAVSKELDLDEDNLVKLSSAIGTGMFLGQTCGAVTAPLMALGLKYGDTEPNRENIRKIYKNTKIFEGRFIGKHSSINCKELKSVHQKDCRDLVHDAVIILKDMLNEEA